MKQFTFSAVMANSIKNLLQRYTKSIRFVAILTMLLIVGIGQVWGAVSSGTTYSVNNSNIPSDWSMYAGANTSESYFILNTNTAYIQTDDFCVESFSSIKLKARKYGGPSTTQLVITVEWIVDDSSTILGTISPTNTTLKDYTISSPTSITPNQEGYVKISCKGASSSKGSGVSAITITYTEGSCSKCTSLVMSEVTATAGDGQIILAWNAVYNANDYEVTCYGGTVGSITGTTTKTCTITGLTNGTEYAWSVMPVGDGSTYCIDNTPATGYATPNVFYNITWKVDGEEYTTGSPTTSVAGGGKVTKLPTAPDPANNCGEVFAGWTTIPIDGTTNDKPSVLFTTAANSPAIDKNTTFYAVFADYEQ